MIFKCSLIVEMKNFPHLNPHKKGEAFFSSKGCVTNLMSGYVSLGSNNFRIFYCEPIEGGQVENIRAWNHI